MTLLGHIADRLLERGFDLLLTRVVPNDTQWLLRLIDSARVDGLIIIGQSNQAEALNLAAAEYKPLVVWGAHLAEQRYCIVGSDNRQGGKLATEHLLAQGCKRLAFFGDPTAPEAEQRLQGFREAVAAAEGKAVGALLPVHFGPESALEAISGYLDLAESLDGIFAASDTIAMIAIQALAQRGRSVPNDVKIVGFDDLYIARNMAPPLTSVRQDLEAGSDALVNALFAIMRGEKATSIVLEPTLVPRGSTVPA
jgi:DNA-binding LacI/PurR family transcriptional regulator